MTKADRLQKMVMEASSEFIYSQLPPQLADIARHCAGVVYVDFDCGEVLLGKGLLTGRFVSWEQKHGHEGYFRLWQSTAFTYPGDPDWKIRTAYQWDTCVVHPKDAIDFLDGCWNPYD